LSIAKRVVKREGGRQRPIQLVAVVSVGTANEDIDHPGSAMSPNPLCRVS